MVAGTRADAERLRDEAAAVLLRMGLQLSEEQTSIVHIDQGFDFLGMHLQRHKQWGSTKRFVSTYPSRTALAAVKAKVRDATRGSTNQDLATLLHRLNFVLRDGQPTTVTGQRPQPSPSAPPSPGGGCGVGYATRTRRRAWECGHGTTPGTGGPSRTGCACSSRRR